jgi:hypothetical protein
MPAAHAALRNTPAPARQRLTSQHLHPHSLTAWIQGLNSVAQDQLRGNSEESVSDSVTLNPSLTRNKWLRFSDSDRLKTPI